MVCPGMKMDSGAFLVICVLVYAFSITGVAGVRRNELYGPRYKPLWDKDAKNNYTLNFGPTAIKNLVENAGFTYENYTLKTEDDYFVNINRMIHPDKLGIEDKGYPLLLLNGFNMQSEGWMVQQMMDSNLAAVWGASGYDVWMADQRGTLRSMAHATLNPATDVKYWDHSTEEIGKYDMATFIDFVLEKTGRKDLVIMCISLGCSFHAALIDARPEYNDKIKGAVYFVPLVNNIKKERDMFITFQSLFIQADFLMRSYEHSDVHQIPPRLAGVKKELYHLCKPFTTWVLLFNILLNNGHVHTPRTLCSQAALSMGGSSVKSAKHLIQMYKHGEFAKYDYGREENMKHYGQPIPPLFNMTKITSFVAIYYSDTDGFASVDGAQRTLKSLSGPTYECNMPGFSHFDVASGTTFKYIMPDVMALLDSITGYSDDTKAMSGKCPSMEWVRVLNN